MNKQSSITINAVETVDLRVPTSDTLLGSDPFHKKPNYSCVVVSIKTDTDLEGLALSFTLGAGTDWIAHGIKDLAELVVGMTLEDFCRDPAAFQHRLLEHHQLRWLADGVLRMAVGGIMNALWDLWAKCEEKPLWKLLVDLDPETIVRSIDWRYLRDVLTPDEALAMLQEKRSGREQREAQMRKRGPKAYSTAGWLGLTDDQIKATCEELKATGFDCFKMKAGQDLAHDKKRLAFIRDVIGNDAHLMLDANTLWGVDEAIAYMKELAEFKPTWIEEPTARDDVMGYQKVAREMATLGIGVAGGEQVPSPVIFKQLLAGGALSFCQIDATRLAGPNDLFAVILMASKYGIPVCPHGGGIGLCNMIVHYALWDQICVSGHSDTQFVEYLNFLQDEVFLHPIQTAGGAYVAPDRPGWGLEMKPDFVERHRYPTGEVWKGREKSGGVTFLA